MLFQGMHELLAPLYYLANLELDFNKTYTPDKFFRECMNY